MAPQTATDVMKHKSLPIFLACIGTVNRCNRSPYQTTGGQFPLSHWERAGVREIRAAWEAARRIWRSRRLRSNRASGRERVNRSNENVVDGDTVCCFK